MIKLECTSCKKVWFTANTEINQRCPECLCLLVEKDFKATCLDDDETLHNFKNISDKMNININK